MHAIFTYTFANINLYKPNFVGIPTSPMDPMANRPRKEKYFRAVRRLFTQLDQNSDGGGRRNPVGSHGWK